MQRSYRAAGCHHRPNHHSNHPESEEAHSIHARTVSILLAMTIPVTQAGWTRREIKLLGTKPDGEVAEKIGRTVGAVSLKRQKLGIEAPLQPAWNEDEIKLLGTKPDREVARIVGRSASAVQTKRLLLGIRSWRARTARVGEPVDPEKAKLLFGPYTPPRTRRGAFLFCELRGTVKVGNYSDGLIPWPMKWRTRSLILCGDLLRAVEQESAMAVGYHWGVCSTIVSRWRGALDVDPITVGTHRLKSYVTTEAMTPTLRVHLSRVKTGKPRKLSRRGKARLLAALHRPKPAKWFTSMARHFEARRGKPVDPDDRAWTPKEEKLLGTKPDREVARMLKRSVGAVIARRKLKGVPYVNPVLRPWTKAEIVLLGKLSDDEIARRRGRSLKSVQAKRQELGLFVRPRSRPWTAREERLLGTRPDTELAAQLKRTRMDVYWHRKKLGIRPAVERPPHREWTAEEDKLLGTESDAAVGRRLGRSAFSVQLRRLRLNLPSHRERQRWPTRR